MKRKKILAFYFFVGMILAVQQVSAGFSAYTNSSFVEKNYLGGEIIRGKLNMSFSAQEDGQFTSSFGGEISALDLLERMNLTRGVDYICVPSDCGETYVAQEINAGTEVSFSLLNRKTLGFRLLGSNVSVQGFLFNVSSFLPEGFSVSCVNQISIDFLDDGNKNFYNTKYAATACGEPSRGCFADEQYAGDSANIESNFVCEKMTLPSAPAYEARAGLIPVNAERTLRFGFYPVPSYPGQPIAPLGSGISVTVPANALEAKGVIKLPSLEEREVMLCVQDNTAQGGSDKLKIKVIVNESGGCGMKVEGAAIVPASGDYDLSAQPLAYDSIGEARFDEEYQKLNGRNIVADINAYLQSKYNKNCPAPSGCVIPFGVQSDLLGGIERDRTVRIKNGELNYRTGIASRTNNTIYFVSRDGALINMNATMLDIGKMGFAAPQRNGPQELKIYFDGEEVFSDTVNVIAGANFSIAPRFVLIERRTTFTASGISNVTSSRWNFGDGSPQITSQNNKAEHTFSDAGDYSVEVQITTLGGGNASIKRFNVIVGAPKISAERLLDEYERRISNVKNSIAEYPTWVANEIKKEVSSDELENQINKLRSDFELLGNASDDEAYIEIIDKLLVIDAPLNVYSSKSGSLPAEVGAVYMNIAALESLSGREAGDVNEVRQAILAWMEQNYNLDVEFEEISATKENGDEKIAGRYKISATKKNAEVLPAFIVFNRRTESVKFKSSYNEQNAGTEQASYIALDSSGNPGAVEFAIIGNPAGVEFLGAYVSPTLQELETGGEILPPDRAEFNWKKFIIGIGAIFFAFLTAYLILQAWYKRYYERRLFANSNDLYNLINFIYNSRKSGLGDGEIKEKLRSKSWKGEQIGYAFRKIDGKRTGMFEIPLFKFAENRKVKEEIEKRQGAPIDARFIKRTEFY